MPMSTPISQNHPSISQSVALRCAIATSELFGAENPTEYGVMCVCLYIAEWGCSTRTTRPARTTTKHSHAPPSDSSAGRFHARRGTQTPSSRAPTRARPRPQRQNPAPRRMQHPSIGSSLTPREALYHPIEKHPEKLHPLACRSSCCIAGRMSREWVKRCGARAQPAPRRDRPAARRWADGVGGHGEQPWRVESSRRAAGVTAVDVTFAGKRRAQ